jgi:hypothetical protein
MSGQSFFKLVFLAALAVGLFASVRALGNLSSEGERRGNRARWLGVFAGREYFSDKGWLYRRIAVFAQLIALGALIGWGLSRR